MREHGATKRWSGALVLALCLAATVSLTSCGGTELSDRYEAEKAAWKIRQLEMAMRSNPELATEEMRLRVVDHYRSLVDAYEPPSAEAVAASSDVSDLARITGQARLNLAGELLRAGDADEAERLYRSVIEAYDYSRSLSTSAYLGLGALIQGTAGLDEAVPVYEALMERWPPAEADGALTDTRVIAIPTQIAATYAGSGEVEKSRAWFERGRASYAHWEELWPGTQTAEAAASLAAETYVREGRWSDAIVAYEEFDREYGNERNRSATWLRLAELWDLRLRNRARARDYYVMVTEAYEGEPAWATAALALARAEMDAGNHEAARAWLNRIVSDFSEDEVVAATAVHHLAVSYEQEGRDEEAMAQYRALSRDYPTTVYGLAAPLRAAAKFMEMGEEEAAAVALDGAAEHYERIARDYASSPAEILARDYLVRTRLAQERWEDAAVALREAADRFTETEAAPSMLLQAADLYAGKLGDNEAALELLRSIVALYHGTEAANEAAARIERLETR